MFLCRSAVRSIPYQLAAASASVGPMQTTNQANKPDIPVPSPPHLDTCRITAKCQRYTP